MLARFFSLVFIFTLFLVSCGGEEEGAGPTPVDPLDTQGNLLNDGTIVDVFTTMTLTISGGSKSGGNYSTSNSDSAEIWPNSGTWTFQNGDKNKLLRSDNVVISISVTETTLRTNFTTTGGLKDGNWVFDFVKQ